MTAIHTYLDEAPYLPMGATKHALSKGKKLSVCRRIEEIVPNQKNLNSVCWTSFWSTKTTWVVWCDEIVQEARTKLPKKMRRTSPEQNLDMCLVPSKKLSGSCWLWTLDRLWNCIRQINCNQKCLRWKKMLFSGWLWEFLFIFQKN